MQLEHKSRLLSQYKSLSVQLSKQQQLHATFSDRKRLKMIKIEDNENNSEKPMFQLFNSSAAIVSKKRKRARAPPGKPPYSYVALITMAINSSPDQKMTLAEILKFIYENFHYYRMCPLRWRDSIRHNLTLNDCFVKLPRDVDDQTRGHYWTVDRSSEMMFDEGKYRRRKKRFVRQDNDEVLPLLIERNRNPGYKSIPTPPAVPYFPRVPVITPVSPVSERRGFTIDEILAPEPNLTNSDISTVYNPTSHFINYRLPNSFIPYYPNMYRSYLFRTYAKRSLSVHSEDDY